MAYPPRQEGPPRSNGGGYPPRGRLGPNGTQNFNGNLGPPPVQQRPVHRGQPSFGDGYYGAEFWQEYGVDPSDFRQQNGQQGPPPQGRPGNFSRPNPGQNVGHNQGPRMGPLGPQGPPNGGRRPPPGYGPGGPGGPGPGMNGPPRGGFRGGFRGGPRGGMPPSDGGRPGPGQRPPPQGDRNMGFDNPFPMFPQGQGPQRPGTAPLEQGMRNMNINGRPSQESSRPPTSTSGKSSMERHGSQNSHYSTDATAYDHSPMDASASMDSFEPRGPPPRSATMPNDFRGQGPPPNDPYGFGSLSPISQRSASSAAMRPQQDPDPLFAPPSRAHTFGDRPFSPGPKNFSRRPDPADEYMPNFDDQPSNPGLQDDWMPNFDAPASNQPMEDPLGLPLDGAPGIVRPGTSQGRDNPSYEQQMGRSRSQTVGNAQGRGGFGEFGPGQNEPPMPMMPGAMAMGARSASPGPGGYRGDMPPGPGGPMRGPMGGPPPNQQSPRGMTPQPGRMTPQQGRMTPQQDNPDALPSFPTPQDENPDALPSHPMPVRPGLSQRQPPNQSPQRQQPPGPPVAPDEDPVSHEELEQLRNQVRSNPQDHPTALRLVKRLSDASTTLVNPNLSPKVLAKERGRYIDEAYKLVKRLVNQSYPDAMFYLADCYGTGQLGLPADQKEAFNLYQAAAKLGHPQSAYRTAVCCEVGEAGTRRDPMKAVQWYRRAAALGDVSAAYKLGMILLRGLLGQQQSTGEAVIWLNRSAERADADNPHALHELAVLHEVPPPDGKVIPDLRYSLQLYQQAADLGYRMSQTRLGRVYENGELGCPADDRASIHWYSQSAAQGEPEAELALSGWYLTGSRGILEANDTEAFLWARKSAQKGFPKAEYAMGHYSETGIGCPVNIEDAKRWYGRAASHGFPKAKEALDNIHRGGSKRRQRYSRSRQNEDCVVM